MGPTITGDYRCDAHEARLDDHELRLRAIERTMYRAIGAAALAAGIVSALASTVLAKF